MKNVIVLKHLIDMISCASSTSLAVSLENGALVQGGNVNLLYWTKYELDNAVREQGVGT